MNINIFFLFCSIQEITSQIQVICDQGMTHLKDNPTMWQSFFLKTDQSKNLGNLEVEKISEHIPRFRLTKAIHFWINSWISIQLKQLQCHLIEFYLRGSISPPPPPPPVNLLQFAYPSGQKSDTDAASGAEQHTTHVWSAQITISGVAYCQKMSRYFQAFFESKLRVRACIILSNIIKSGGSL